MQETDVDAAPETGPNDDRAHQTRGRRVVALLLAGAALACSVAALIGPAKVTRSTFAWSATDDQLDLPLILSAERPDSIDIRFPCEVARSIPSGSIFRTNVRPIDFVEGSSRVTKSGVNISSDGTTVRVQSGRSKALSLPVGTEPCEVRVEYTARDGTTRLTIGSESIETATDRRDQPIVTGIHAHPATAGSELTARIVTQPTGSSPSRRQIAALVTGALCALGAILLVRAPRPRTAPARWIRSPLAAPSDAVVGFVTLVSAVLIPPQFDDGWVLATVRGFSSTGRFSTYYEREAVSLVQGTWWDGLLYPYFSHVDNLVLLRLPFALLAFAAWWVLRRWVIDQWSEGIGRRRARFAGAAATVVVVPATLVTMRPEPLIALLGAITLAATVRFCLRPQLAPLVVGMIASVLAVTTHQTGYVVVTAMAPAVLFVVPWLRREPRAPRAFALVVAVVLAAALAVFLMGLDTDLSLLRMNVKAYSDTARYSAGPFDEWQRLYELVIVHPAARRIAVILPAFGLLAALAARSQDREPSAERISLWCAVSGYAGLLFTSSKLTWHYGAVMPFAVVLVSVGFTRLLADASQWAAFKRITGAVVVALVGAWGLASLRHFNSFDLASKDWNDLRVVLDRDVSRPYVWLAALVVIAAGTGFLLRKRGPRARDPSPIVLAAALLLTCTVPIVLTWVLLLDDARATDGWSFTDQQLQSATGRDHCGLEGMPVVASATPLSQVSLSPSATDTTPAAPDGYAHLPANSSLPVEGIATYGTFNRSAATPDRAQTTGRFSTPWFDVVPGELAFWSTGRAKSPNQITIESVEPTDPQPLRTSAARPTRSTGRCTASTSSHPAPSPCASCSTTMTARAGLP